MTEPRLSLGQVSLASATVGYFLQGIIALTVSSGECWAIMGASGAGSVAECGYELPSSPTLLPREKGVKILVPSPLGEG